VPHPVDLTYDAMLCSLELAQQGSAEYKAIQA
jgi:hypothetical protein